MAENEAYFRSQNESVGEGMQALQSSAIDEGYKELHDTTDFMLQFHCECADEDCARRIKMKMSTYSRIHSDRDCFIITPQHNVASIENPIKKFHAYWIVEKTVDPPEAPQSLNQTTLRHA